MNLINLDTLSTNKKLTPSESYLLDFINTSPEYFCSEKISNIAKAANVSTSSITRLAKKLGFESLKHLQLHVLYKKSYIKDNYEIADGVGTNTTFQNLKNYHLYSISELFNTLDLEKTLNLVQDLKDSNRIMIYGINNSFSVAAELSSKLIKIGLNILCFRDFYETLMNLPLLTQTDHLLLFTKNGNTKEIQFLITQALKSKINVSVVTSNADLKNSKKIKNLVTFVTNDQKEQINSLSSKIAQLIVADFIYLEIFDQVNGQEKINKEVELTNEWKQKFYHTIS